MGTMKIKKMVLGMVSTNCYIVSNEETNEALIIDPAASPERLIQYIAENKLELKAILLTHGHFDHIMGIDGLLSAKNVPVYCEESEQELLKDAYINLSQMMGQLPYTLETVTPLKDGQKIHIASFEITALHTPGHTKGSACYVFEEEKCIFSGDTLFFESVGRTDFPTGSSVAIIQSIKEKLYVYNDNYIVYPGHGPETSIGYEKENNPYTSEEGLWM